MDVFFIDRMMCSDICPCNINYKSQWEEKYPDAQLKQRMRTWQNVGLMPITPMTFITPGEKKDVKVFDTFDDCYMSKIAGKHEKLGPAYAD